MGEGLTETKVRIANTDNGCEGALRPIARSREDIDMAVAENIRIGLDPSRWNISLLPRLIDRCSSTL